jgi:flagellar protein FlgJ
MMNQVDMSQQLALDANGLSKLQRSARENSPEALKAVAEQFEALFLNMMLKSMREAGGGEGGIFDNEQSKMYTSMLDQQMTQSIASRGVGLADVLIRQLSPQHMALDPDAAGKVQPDQAKLQEAMDRMLESRSADAVASVKGNEVSAAAQKTASDKPAHIQSFQSRMEPHAEAASRITGIPSKFILAQAALESGWGKREIVGMDGTHSHNVFGIKATGGWKGKVVETMTTEYVDGVPQRKVEKFRAYDSYADAFRDYAKLLSDNPRYQDVIAQGRNAAGFASGLQRAGYATDPNYAEKLSRIIRNNLS